MRVLRHLPLTPEIIETLLIWDWDSQSINFPKDGPNRELTIERLKREWREDAPDTHMFVFDGDGRDPIWCVFLEVRENPYRRCRYVDLRNYYVVPEHRGQGFIRLYTEYAIALARTENARGMGPPVRYLSMGTGIRQPALKGFEREGFRPTRIMLERDLNEGEAGVVG